MIYILRFVTTISHIKTLARASLSLIQYGFEELAWCCNTF